MGAVQSDRAQIDSRVATVGCAAGLGDNHCCFVLAQTKGAQLADDMDEIDGENTAQDNMLGDTESSPTRVRARTQSRGRATALVQDICVVQSGCGTEHARPRSQN